MQTQFLEDLIQIIRDVLILCFNDSTGDAEIRGFKNTGSGTHEQTILLDASGNSYLKGGNVALGHDNAVKLLHL